MTGYPKQKWKKKRIRHRRSILPTVHKGSCFLCALLHEDERQKSVLHTHHVFGGPNRKASEQYGLTVPLCPEHHTEGKEAAHRNQEIAALLHRLGQEAFEKRFPDLDFLEIFGRNYK